MPHQEGTHTPQEPDPDRSPEQIVYFNLSRMMIKNEMTVEQANKFLDDLGLPETYRFWSHQRVTNPSTGRIYNHPIAWHNGKWENGAKEHQQDIRNVLNEGKK